jgi:hypothetical protein
MRLAADASPAARHHRLVRGDGYRVNHAAAICHTPAKRSKQFVIGCACDVDVT